MLEQSKAIIAATKEAISIKMRSDAVYDLREKLKTIDGTVEDLYRYADYCGEIASAEASKALFDIALLNRGYLPDEELSSLFYTVYDQTHGFVAAAAADRMTAEFAKSGFQIAADAPKLKKNIADALINTVKAAKTVDEGARAAKKSIRTETKKIIDSTSLENIKRARELGLKIRIHREAKTGCCDWCKPLYGSYDYRSEPKDFWKRHADCRCTIYPTFSR